MVIMMGRPSPGKIERSFNEDLNESIKCRKVGGGNRERGRAGALCCSGTHRAPSGTA